MDLVDRLERANQKEEDLVNRVERENRTERASRKEEDRNLGIRIRI